MFIFYVNISSKLFKNIIEKQRCFTNYFIFENIKYTIYNVTALKNNINNIEINNI